MTMNGSKVSNYLKTKINDRNVLLKEGNFVLNSGEISPFYFDFSKFSDSEGLVELGFVIWTEIHEMKVLPDVIFGVATKGIILVSSACLYSYIFGDNHKDYNLSFAFDRKENFKQHGEKGDYVGCDLRNKSVLIVDDVFVTGKAIRKSLNLVKRYTQDISIMVMINRSEIEEIDGYPVKSILSFPKDF